MEMIPIRLLRADEIECRVSTINEKGLALLLFKDARVDQKLLDEAFTSFGWKRSHQMIGGNLYCTVEVWDQEKQQWVAKQDVGTMSYSEKEKGQASDSFKRACFNWGLGRELYTAPLIWIPAEMADIRKKGQGRDQKYYTYDRFQVQSISYDRERSIEALTIVNARNQVVYAMDKRRMHMAEGKKPAEKPLAGETAPAERRMIGKTPSGKVSAGNNFVQDRLGALCQEQQAALEQELQRTGVALDVVLQRYHLTSPGQIN